MFTLTDVWDCYWMLKHSQLHISSEKRSFYPPHALKIYIVFPIFLQQDASQQVMKCWNVCFLSLLDVMFFYIHYRGH